MYLKTVHLIFWFIREPKKFIFEILLARGLNFCSFAFRCNNHPLPPPPPITPVQFIWFWYFISLFIFIYIYIFFLDLFFFCFCFCFLLLLLLFLLFLKFVLREANIIDYIRNSAPSVCFTTFNGIKLPLMALVDLYEGGPAFFQSKCQPDRRGQNCSCF